MKYLIVNISLLIVTLCFSTIASGNQFTQEEEIKICNGIKSAQKQMNKRGPVNVDEVTVFITMSVNCVDKVVSYTKLIDLDPSLLNDEWKERTKIHHNQIHCSKYGLSSFSGYTVRDVFLKQDYTYFTTFINTPNDCDYVEELADIKKHEQETITYPDGSKYVGGLKDNKHHGQGTLTHPDGWYYAGGWKDGKQYGQGTLTDPDGQKYVGGWKNGKRHGQGAQTYPSGAKYVGGWKNGKMYGKATITRSDNGKYVGEVQGRMFHGQGTLTLPDGQKYVGGWKYNKMDGQGTLTLPDGRKFVGEWKDGKPWVGVALDDDGTVNARIVDGK